MEDSARPIMPLLSFRRKENEVVRCPDCIFVRRSTITNLNMWNLKLVIQETARNIPSNTEVANSSLGRSFHNRKAKRDRIILTNNTTQKNCLQWVQMRQLFESRESVLGIRIEVTSNSTKSTTTVETDKRTKTCRITVNVKGG
jgi:hypothetical protein